MTMVTGRKLAEVRGEEFEAFHAQVNENARRFYGVE
jgi:Tat protein secretion system quality control protein TatD with DNase activity